MLMLRDVTTYQLLQDERSKVKLMKLLQATVSHDVMSPIGNIEYFVKKILECYESGDTKSFHKYVTLILDSLKIMSCRTQDLLDQNLIENKCFNPKEVEFNATDAIDQMRRLFKPQLEAKKASLSKNYHFEVNQFLVGDV